MNRDPQKNLKDYARYSGMAFQMLAIILLGAWGGWKADQWLSVKPLFTIVLTTLAVAAAIYLSIRELLRK